MLNVRTIFAVYFCLRILLHHLCNLFVAFMIEGSISMRKRLATYGLSSLDVHGERIDLGISLRPRRKKTCLLWNNGIISLAVFLPLSFQQPLFLAVSTFPLRADLPGTVTIVAASIGDLVGERRASVYGLVTLIHGIGQLLGRPPEDI